MAVLITGVEENSPAYKAGVRPGDRLVSLGGHEVADVLDYRFYMLEPRLTVELLRGERPLCLTLEKEEYEDPGMAFETYLMDKQRGCRNGCIFCFIDQLPPGLRESLYFKDDDARLSFLFGNYITMTNLSEREVQRICDMHISPMNLSVHTTNPALRCRMMRNRRAGEVLDYLPRFAAAGVRMNCQLVLLPGVNDGPELTRTLKDLTALYPAVQSIAAVPVGLTRYRQGLTELAPYAPAQAAAVIDEIEAFGSRLLQRHGTRLCYPADEFYLTAGRPLPAGDFYEDYPQLENGVGMWALFNEEFDAALESTPTTALPSPRRVTVATGVAAAPLLRQCAARATARYPGLKVEVRAVENRFFGPNITVSGLLTGRDLAAALTDPPPGEAVLVPAAALRHEGDLFLDDLSLQELSRKIDRPVFATGDAASFLAALLGKTENAGNQ